MTDTDVTLTRADMRLLEKAKPVISLGSYQDLGLNLRLGNSFHDQNEPSTFKKRHGSIIRENNETDYHFDIGNSRALKDVSNIIESIKYLRKTVSIEIEDIEAHFNVANNAYTAARFNKINILISRLSFLIFGSVRESVWTLTLALFKIMDNIGYEPNTDDLYRFKLRRKLKEYQNELARELIDRALDSYGVHGSLHEKSRKIIERVLAEAAAETMNLSRKSLLNDEAVENVSGLYVPQLSDEQIRLVVARGLERPWSERPMRNMSPFEWVRSNYSEWIPGLLQSHLLLADRPLYFAFKTRILRQGMPDWLDVPTAKDANLRNTAGLEAKQQLLAQRERTKHRMRIARAFQQD